MSSLDDLIKKYEQNEDVRNVLLNSQMFRSIYLSNRDVCVEFKNSMDSIIYRYLKGIYICDTLRDENRRLEQENGYLKTTNEKLRKEMNNKIFNLGKILNKSCIS